MAIVELCIRVFRFSPHTLCGICDLAFVEPCHLDRDYPYACRVDNHTPVCPKCLYENEPCLGALLMLEAQAIRFMVKAHEALNRLKPDPLNVKDLPSRVLEEVQKEGMLHHQAMWNEQYFFMLQHEWGKEPAGLLFDRKDLRNEATIKEPESIN